MKRTFSIALIFALMVLAVLAWMGTDTLHAQSGHAIVLTWSAPTTGGAPTTYNILRGTTSGGETALASVPASQLTYSDASGVGGTKYFYEVTAQNAAGTSAPSNEASATFFLAAPGAPTGLGAVSN